MKQRERILTSKCHTLRLSAEDISRNIPITPYDLALQVRIRTQSHGKHSSLSCPGDCTTSYNNADMSVFILKYVDVEDIPGASATNNKARVVSMLGRGNQMPWTYVYDADYIYTVHTKRGQYARFRVSP